MTKSINGLNNRTITVYKFLFTCLLFFGYHLFVTSVNTFQKFVMLCDLRMKFQTWHGQIHFRNENWFHFCDLLTSVFIPQTVHERKKHSTGEFVPGSAKANWTIFSTSPYSMFICLKLMKYFNLPLSGIFPSFPTSNCLISVICHIFLDKHGLTDWLNSSMTRVWQVFTMCSNCGSK